MTIYIEANAGISGDMTVAALLDLGADKKVLEDALASIDAEGFEIKISKVKKAGLEATDFDVVLDKEHDGHDHDMEYLYGHEHHHEHSHGNHEHHEHDHSHEEHDHAHHKHRGMNEINAILDKCSMTNGARKICDDIFAVIAEAEAKAHGVPLAQVHFHEVGAIDSIVDIVAVAVCMDNLGVTEVVVPKLCDGKGTVRCQHGILPVPVPAVLNIIASHGITLEILDLKGELVTPTGAAIVAATMTGDKLPKEFKVKRVGMGAGKRDTGLVPILRIMEIE